MGLQNPTLTDRGERLSRHQPRSIWPPPPRPRSMRPPTQHPQLRRRLHPLRWRLAHLQRGLLPRQKFGEGSVHQFVGVVSRLGRIPVPPAQLLQLGGQPKDRGRGKVAAEKGRPAPRRGDSTVGTGTFALRWPTMPSGSRTSGGGCETSLAAQRLQSAWPRCGAASQNGCRGGRTTVLRGALDATSNLRETAPNPSESDLESARPTAPRPKRVLALRKPMVGRQLKTLKYNSSSCTASEFMTQLARHGPLQQSLRLPLTLDRMGLGATSLEPLPLRQPPSPRQPAAWRGTL